jgi:hypothetical protein
MSVLKQGVLALLLAGGVVGAAQAAPLGLTAGSPDITAGFIDVSYDKVTGAFSASGFALGIQPGGINLTTGDPNVYSIVATISDAGVLSAGSILVTGDLDGPGGNGALVLLSGTLAAVGFDDSLISTSSILEFLVNVNGGLPAFTNAGVAGVILAPFVYPTSIASSDNFVPIPEPASISLLLTGLLLAGPRRARR